MRKTAILICILLTQVVLFGQKTTVAIKTLRTVSGSDYYGRSKMTTGEAKIEDFVTNKFVNTKKFDILDRASLNDLKSEKELQKSEDFIDGKVIEQSKTLGADYLVGIYISTLDLTKSGTTSYTYGCKMTFSLKVLDIATSQIITTETFSSSAGQGLLSFINTPDDAVEKCLTNISAKVEDFIKANFPIKASIANIEESDANGAASKVLISAGSSNGVSVGDNFKVLEAIEMEVDGKKMIRKKEVGTLQIISIEDENFSVCLVTKGGADIAKKKTEGKKLQVIAVK